MTQVPHKLLTVAAYARHRGCSRPAVSKALREKRITLTAEGLIDPVAADAQWQARTRPRATTKPAAAELPLASDAPDVSYQEAKRRQAVADMLQAERNAAVQAGTLLRFEVVRDEMARHLTAAREIALSCASRLAPILAAEADAAKVHELIRVEMHRMLHEMAGVDTAIRP